MGFSDLNNTGGGGPGSLGYGEVPTPLYRILDTNGDGTGVTNVTGNYSATPTDFYIQPPSGSIFRLERMMVYTRVLKGKQKIDTYVNANPLTNGITVKTYTNSGATEVTDYTNSEPIKRLGGWARVAFDVNFLATTDEVETDSVAAARWTFSKAGYPVRLVGDNGDRLTVRVNDNFSAGDGMEDHMFMIQGYIENTT